MKTIGNYNAQRTPYATYLVSIALVFPAFLLQFFYPASYSQGIDLTESFFINVWVSQFAHLSWNHLILNTAGLGLITWGLAFELPAKKWFLIATVSLFATPLWITYVEPLNWYCGLSGALHAQFTTLLAIALLREPFAFKRSWPLWTMLLGLICKLIIEFFEAREFDTLIGGNIAIEAHRGGVVFGVATALIWHLAFAPSKN